MDYRVVGVTGQNLYCYVGINPITAGNDYIRFFSFFY